MAFGPATTVGPTSISNAWSTVLQPHGSISVFCVHRLAASALDRFLCCGATVPRRTPSPQVARNSSHAAVISNASSTEKVQVGINALLD
jgi:hypothetical protein